MMNSFISTSSCDQTVSINFLILVSTDLNLINTVAIVKNQKNIDNI